MQMVLYTKITITILTMDAQHSWQKLKIGTDLARKQYHSFARPFSKLSFSKQSCRSSVSVDSREREEVVPFLFSASGSLEQNQQVTTAQEASPIMSIILVI